MSSRRALALQLALACGLALAAILALSVLAVETVHSLQPDVPIERLITTLPMLIAGGLASSGGLLVAVVVVTRPLTPAALRLRPGRETGRVLALAVVGTLALGQALDSVAVLSGLAQHGSMAAIRRTLQGAGGLELFAAVVVIGVLAAGAEEVFFRGYLQSRLRQAWGAGVAVVGGSVAFAALHVDWLHAVMALALGLYLGALTEMTGSALPAVVCHMVNNVLYTLVAATLGVVPGTSVNAVLLVAGATVFGVAVAGLRRTLGESGRAGVSR